MSLSKYYERSASFQPEELVKPESGRPKPSWPPLPRSEDRFLASRLLEESRLTAPPQAPPQDAPEEEIATAQVPEEVPVQPPPPSGQLPPEEKIDLSQYVERAVAARQREEAYREGFEKGRTEERKAAEEDFAAAGRALLSSCQQLESLRETIIANSSRELVDFTLAMAEKIVRVLVREQDATIVATIEEALRRAVKSEEFTIFLNPDDYAAVAARAGEIVSGISGLNNIVLRKDKSIERGGAKIESDNCTIDATLAGQFDLIREEMKKRVA